MSGAAPGRDAPGSDGGRAAAERTLDDWLDPELAAAHPATARSRLREIARAHGARQAAWAAGIGIGATLIVLGVVVSLHLGSPAPLWPLGGIGAALALGCGAGVARSRDRLPDADSVIVIRGPGSAGRGLLFAGGIVAAFVIVFASASGAEVWQDPARLAPFAIALLCVVGLVGAGIVVPALILGRSRAALRRRAARDRRFRELLERDLRAWSARSTHGSADGSVDRGGMPFGPL